MVDPADADLVKVPLGVLDIGAPTVVEGDLEHPVVLDGGRDHLSRLHRIERERLLAEDVLACGERGDGDRVVQGVRGRDAHDVEVRECDESLPLGLEVGDLVDRPQGGEALGLLSGEGDDLDPRQAPKRLDVHGTHAEPDHTHSQGAAGDVGGGR